MRFNVNNKVKVKLTDEGRAVHKKDHEEFWKQFPEVNLGYIPPKEDKDGWSTWQLWVFMERFGKYMHNGCSVLFETEIEIL